MRVSTCLQVNWGFGFTDMNLEQLFQSQQQLLSVHAGDTQKPVNERNSVNLGASISSSQNDENLWGSVSAESKQEETRNISMIL